MSAYSDAVLADAPLAYYRLGDAGSVLADSSGNGRDAAYTSGTQQQPGLLPNGDPDKAILNGRGTVTSPTWSNALPGLALECWIQTLSGSAQTLIARSNAQNFGQANNHVWRLYASGGNLIFQVFGATWNPLFTVTTTGPSVSAGAVHHVVATWDGVTAKVYIDGVMVKSAAAAGTMGSATGRPLCIGWMDHPQAGSQFPFQGVLDEVAVYDHALTAARVQAHYDIAHSVPGAVEGTTAQEADTARPGAVIMGVVTGSTALEVDTARPGTIETVEPATGSTRTGGRPRTGQATATWTPPIVAPPATLAVQHAHIAASAYGPVTIKGSRPTFTTSTAHTPRARTRIVVGGLDVTFLRGAPTPPPRYTLTEPLLYGPCDIDFPQVAACFETPGVGALRWCRIGAPVLVQRVLDGVVVGTDYRGVVVAHNTSGAQLTLEIGGEAQGRAALRDKQPPIFRHVTDVGHHAWKGIKDLGLRFAPRLGPETGIRLAGIGGMSHLDYLHEVCAKAWTRSGNQWTIMPDPPEEGGRYRMFRKDTTTVDCTIFTDDTRAVPNLRSDAAEEPNRVFVTGVTPDGQRVRFGVYPGLKQGAAAPYPFNDGRTFAEGTTNGDTNTGDGISVLVNRLWVTGYLSLAASTGGYDPDVTRAVTALQEDAELPATGDVDLMTWRTLFDLDATGYSLRGSHIEPAAQTRAVRRHRRTASGAIIGRNPHHNPHKLVVDSTIDMGTGFTRQQMRRWARAELAQEPGHVGTITVTTGAVLAGEVAPGAEVTPAMLLDGRALRPGMNAWLPQYAGGVLVHVSAIEVREDFVELTVDSRARDALKVWEIIARNRESRRDPARRVRGNRASTTVKDSIDVWDEVGGVLGDRVDVPERRWVVFPIVSGQAGTVQRLAVETSPPAEFTLAVFGRRIWPRRLARLVGDPLTVAGSRRWERERTREELAEIADLLYVAGSETEPCGYWPKSKGGVNDTGEDDAPLTGRWDDEAGFPYYTQPASVLWVAVFADRDTHVTRGRIMWPVLEAGV